MSALWSVAAGVALSGLQEIRGPMPAPALPPFAVSTALTLAAAGAGVLSLTRKRPLAGEAPQEQRQDLTAALGELRKAYALDKLTELQLFENLFNLLRSALAPERPDLTTDEVMAAARARLPERPLDLLAVVLNRCDAVRYGKATLGKELGLQVLADTVAAVRALSEFKT